MGAALRRIACWGTLLILVITAACTGKPADPPRPATRSTGPAATSFPAAPADQTDVPVGDQIDQSLSELAADGSTVVAVGQDTSANVTRPLLLRSADGGRSWRRAAIDTAGRTPGPDESVGQVTHGRKGFVALGVGGDGEFIIWHSADGRSWQRAPVDKSILRGADSIGDLVATRTGYMMVGDTRGRHGSTLGSLLTWTSPDGITWTRHVIASRVLSGVVGVPSATGLTIGDDEMIITGDVENTADTEQPNRILILRSTDNGSHWTKINTPADLAGGYRAYSQDLIFADGRYLLLALGDGADSDGSSWDSVLLSGGPDGTRWRRVASPTATGSSADDYGQVLLPMPTTDGTGHGWLVAGSIGKSPSDGLLAVGSAASTLRRLRSDALTGTRSQELTDGLVADGAAILLGSDGRTGSDDPMILRVEGDLVSRVDLGDLGGTAVPDVDAVIKTAGGYRAVGTLNRTPLLWTGRDGLSWRPQVLPARGHGGVISARATDVAADTDGTAIAVGTLTRNRGSWLGVWSIDAAGRPQQLNAPEFVSPVADDYGYLEARTITHGAGGWVIGAVHSANGRNDIWLLHSSDGEHWTRAKGTVRARLDEDSERDHRTPWATFHGPANGDIVVSRVVPVGRGFVAVGATFDGATAVPVSWRSDDGLTWTEREALPLPAGVSDVGVEAAAGSPTSVVAAGQTSGRVPDDEQARVSWRLDLDRAPASDRTARWRVGKKAAERSSILSILPIKGGFLGTGKATVHGAADARWWRSRDGLSWSQVPLPRRRTSGAGEQRIEKVLPAADGLLLWGWDVPPAGGGDYTVRVPMPQ
ncbi:beta propeller repeat protein [Microlunatus soli]|uniref:BNR repeat-like domain-containing protein n=1 Tax=Microlunatus soli TaxID=630515 RepID=A0A1H1VR60_9ACTN|nr:hypothetical protein [Microlunatus soli]SDS86911.1 hypothetical protein SAMN04489812_3306 [Microlunatus soli]